MGAGFWDLLLAACALMLVLEGLLPMLAPALWRDVFTRLAAQTDGQLRFVGLSFVAGGVLLLAFFLPG